MLKKIILGILATTIVAAPVALAAAPAEAALGDNHSITKTEFRKITKGMSMTRAHNIIDYKGNQSWYDSGYPGPYGWPASQSREYRQAGTKYGSAYIDFERVNGVWKVDSKSAYWW